MIYRLHERCSEILLAFCKLWSGTFVYTRACCLWFEKKDLLWLREHRCSRRSWSKRLDLKKKRKTAMLFHAKLKCFPWNFEIPAGRKERFFPCIFLASVAIRSTAKYSSGERFPLRGFRIRQLPGALTVFTRISIASCSFSVYGTLKRLLAALSNEKSINALPFSSPASKAINDVLPGNIWYWYYPRLCCDIDAVTNVVFINAVILLKNIFHIFLFNKFFLNVIVARHLLILVLL